MIIALDKKAEDIYPPNIQLRTPLTQYKKRSNLVWALDNGAYTFFDEVKWLRMVEDAITDPNCIWFTMPDEVGDHERTTQLFNQYSAILERRHQGTISHKAAFVIQDGCTVDSVPWQEITAVFLGGTTRFKLSAQAWRILEAARSKDKWVHIGRVNTPNRARIFHQIADSIDGSGLSRFKEHLEIMEACLEEMNGTIQHQLFPVEF